MDAAPFIVRRFRPAIALLPAVIGCSTPSMTAAEPHGPIARPQAPADPADAAPYRRYPAPIVPVGMTPAPVVPVGGPTATPTPPPGSSGTITQTSFGANPDRADSQLRVVAVIGRDVVITDDEVWQMVRQRAREYVQLTGPAREAKEKEMFAESLRTLIDRELILADFIGKLKENKPGLVDKLQDESRISADKELDRFRKLNNITDEADFARALRSQGMTIPGLRRQIERKAMTDIYVSQLMKEKKSSVTLAQVHQYYREHADEFKVEDEVRWLDLFVSYRRFDSPDEARAFADKLRRQAASGAGFVALVKESGHGDSVLRDGEGIGTKPGEILPRELESTVFSLQSGQVSDLIPTATGYHVVKVNSRTTAGVKPFDEETQKEIRGKLTQNVAREEYQRVIEDLWRKTTVRIVDQP